MRCWRSPTRCSCAVRDLTGRRIAGDMPGMIVAISAVVVVLAGASIAHLLARDMGDAGWRDTCSCFAGSGLFLMFGHFFIFMAYRVGPTRRGGAVLLLLHRLGGDFRTCRVRPPAGRDGGAWHRAGGGERADHRAARSAPTPACSGHIGPPRKFRKPGGQPEPPRAETDLRGRGKGVWKAG